MCHNPCFFYIANKNVILRISIPRPTLQAFEPTVGHDLVEGFEGFKASTCKGSQDAFAYGNLSEVLSNAAQPSQTLANALAINGGIPKPPSVSVAGDLPRQLGLTAAWSEPQLRPGRMSG